MEVELAEEASKQAMHSSATKGEAMVAGDRHV